MAAEFFADQTFWQHLKRQLCFAVAFLSGMLSLDSWGGSVRGSFPAIKKKKAVSRAQAVGMKTLRNRCTYP
ncbi:hypothetical protein ACL7TT_04805 [Microbulbifer sp. 2304DJ12-6]|uniref:hypothetical protein n=1 Tax=Microbulbifer sp. 2304DJ12-6 TaxID=3233340 RepID=UPI0039AF456E